MMENKEQKNRKSCICMGRIHPIINNCISCGKIVCKSEGEGECLFCGNLVYSKQNQDKEDLSYQRKFEDDYETLKDYSKAVVFKEKLLDYDKSEIATKNVYDEEADWYEIKEDIWQENEIRNIAKKKILETEKEEEENKNYTSYDINFKTGDIIEKNKLVDYKEKREEAKRFVKEEEAKLKKKKKNLVQNDDYEEEDKIILNGISEELTKFYKVNEQHEEHEKKSKLAKILQHDDVFENFKNYHKLNKNKINEDKNNYDRDLYNLEDFYDYKCLSMWQPWASLVIEGIKRFEGRNWSTEYRGPLWIHAGFHPFSENDIKHTKSLYEKIYKKDFPGYPQKLDKGYIIGIVDLQDVWTSEEFKKRIHAPFNEESDNPYVFVFRNPRRLLVPVKLQGEQMIFNLKKEIISKAINSLQKIPTNFCPYFAEKYIELSLRKKSTVSSAFQNQNIDKDKKKKIEKKDIPCEVLKFTQDIVLLEIKEKIIFDYFYKKDEQMGKSLHNGYNNKKSFNLENKELNDFFLNLIKKHLPTSITQNQFNYDIFRLDLKDKKIKLEKKYNFLYFLGNFVKLEDNLAKSYLVGDSHLFLNLNNNQPIIISLIDKKKKTSFLNIKGDYCTIGMGVYLV